MSRGFGASYGPQGHIWCVGAVVMMSLVTNACGDNGTPSKNPADTGAPGNPATDTGSGTHPDNTPDPVDNGRPTTPTNDAGRTDSMAVDVGGPDARGVDSGSGAPETPSSAGGFVTNVPGLQLKPLTADDTTGLALISFTFVPSPSYSNYVEAFGEVVNRGTETWCLSSLNFQVTDGSGTLWEDTAYVDGPAYLRSGSTVSSVCLAPGDHGGLWTNGEPAEGIALSDVKGLKASFSALPSTGILPDGITTLSPIVYAAATGLRQWKATGTLTVTKPITNVRVTVYPKDSAGLILRQLAAFELTGVSPSAPWKFETITGVSDGTELGPAPVSSLSSVEYIVDKGTVMQSQALASADPYASARAQRDKFVQERDARRASAKQ